MRHLARGAVLALCIVAVVETMVFDVFPVQTGSMEPTLRGLVRGGDRILASRWHQEIFGTSRFGILSFRYPNNEEVGYLKRVVGLSGEQILIRGGDLFSGPSDEVGDRDLAKAKGRLAILRKPRGVQDALFEAHPVATAESFRQMDAIRFAMLFEWRSLEPVDATVADGVLSFVADQPWVLAWVPGVPDRAGGTTGATRAQGKGEEVADLSLRLGVGLPVPWLSVSFEDPRGEARPEIVLASSEDGDSVEIEIRRKDAVMARTRLRTEGRESLDLRVDDVDDRVSVTVDKALVLSRDYFAPIPPRDAGEARAGFVLRGSPGPARLAFLGLHRDIHYRPDAQDRFVVPEGCGLALGDNTAGSADSRAWRQIEIQDRRTGESWAGDSGGVSARELLLPDGNPWRETHGGRTFVDRKGRNHEFKDERQYRTVGVFPTPCFRLDEVESTALAILFPLRRAGALR